MNIMGQKIVKASISICPGKAIATFIELDGGAVLFGRMRIVRKAQGICAECGELIPQGCCNCGPEQRLVTLDFGSALA